MSNKNNDDLHWGGGLNPLNFPHKLQQYRTEDANSVDPRNVQDPHKWENPDPSLRARATPSTVAGWMGAAVAVLAIGGLAFYLFPVFAPAFRNEGVLGGVGVVSFLILFHLWSRQKGVQAVGQMDKSIVYYGEEADVRLGEYQGTTGRSHLFTPYVDLSYGAFNARPLKKRDLPFDPSRLRSSFGRKDKVGKEPVVDRLNRTTAEADTETYGKTLITHAATMEFDTFGRDSDRYTTRPQTIDEDVARRMNELIESLETSIRTLEQQKSMLEERVEGIRDTKQMAVVDELRGALNLMEKMSDLAAQQRHPQHPQAGESGDGSLSNGTGLVNKLEQDIADELEDR